MPKLPQILAVPENAPLYGSSRLGSRKERVCMTCTTATLPAELQGISYVIRGEKSYELSNHLGNVLAVVSDRREAGACTDSLVDFYYADGRSVSDYYPFGMAMDIRTQSAGGYRWGFNGQEKDDEIAGEGNAYDFGARVYDSRLGRWMSPDPHESNYPGLSPYIFVGNMPTRAVDPDGRDIYILFYVDGHNKKEDNEMFFASALTRKVDIEGSKGFDPTKDKVVILAVQDLASIQKQVNDVVATYSPQYGQTQEFSIWSHGGTDGPVGATPTSTNAFEGTQMSLTGWGQIDFNWKNDGHGTNANFFGCNTGANGKAYNMVDNGTGGVGLEFYSTPSFANQVSALRNFQNVSVAGQTTASFPSQFTNYRANSENGPGNFINFIAPIKGGGHSVSFERTYMVGGERRRNDLFGLRQNVANPMQYNTNGEATDTGFQSGTTKP